MIRLTATALLIALLAAAPAQALSLKPTVSVAGEVVRLGDFFAGAGEHADVALFRAPEPGSDGVVSTDRLRKAVRRLGISWAPPYGLRHVKVTRSLDDGGQAVSLATIETHLTRAIAQSLPGAHTAEDVAITLDHGEAIGLRGDGTHAIDVARLDIDPRDQTFAAALEVREGTLVRAFTFSGSYRQFAQVPVLAVDVDRGEIINEWHLTTVRVPPEDGVSAASSDDIVGKVAQRRLKAGDMPNPGDLEAPKVIERGELVTIMFHIPGLTLTTQGRALADAAAGETVSVRNVTSNRVIHAIAEGPGQVSVGPSAPTHLAMR